MKCSTIDDRHRGHSHHHHNNTRSSSSSNHNYLNRNFDSRRTTKKSKQQQTRTKAAAATPTADTISLAKRVAVFCVDDDRYDYNCSRSSVKHTDQKSPPTTALTTTTPVPRMDTLQQQEHQVRYHHHRPRRHDNDAQSLDQHIDEEKQLTVKTTPSSTSPTNKRDVDDVAVSAADGSVEANIHARVTDKVANRAKAGGEEGQHQHHEKKSAYDFESVVSPMSSLSMSWSMKKGEETAPGKGGGRKKGRGETASATTGSSGSGHGGVIPNNSTEEDLQYGACLMSQVRHRRRKQSGSSSWLLPLAICFIIGGVAAIIAGIVIKKQRQHQQQSMAQNNNNNQRQKLDGYDGPTTDIWLYAPTPAPSVAPTYSLYDVIHDAGSSVQVVPEEFSPTSPNRDDSYTLLLEPDAESYQSRAFQWLQETTLSTSFPRPESDARLIQRYALACLYYATYAVPTEVTDTVFGEDVVFPWIDRTNWLTAEDECTWRGVICSQVDNTHVSAYSATADAPAWVVTSLNLEQNMLTGSLPPELALLTDLTVLLLSGNTFYNPGDQSQAWLGQLTNLRYLFHEGSYMPNNSGGGGGIPRWISSLTNLVAYDGRNSMLSGPIDEDVLMNLTTLEHLNIGGNAFQSSIPPSIGMLPNLRYFYADDSQITGDLSFVTGMGSIVELSLNENPELAGEIPASIGEATSLAMLSVGSCNLTGQIPSKFPSRLQQLSLYNNRLTGPVPAELSKLSLLSTLELEANQLSSLPTSICDQVIPNGLLRKLEADCDVCRTTDANDYTGCCTCCGVQCLSFR